MKKYKINWLVVARNLAFIFLVIMLVLSNRQLKNNEVKLQEFKNDIVMVEKQLRHGYLSRLNHGVHTYIPLVEKPEMHQSRNGRTYLGSFKITHYCACTKCCGKNAQGITASGAKVQEGVTIAVDRKVIKLGSKVYIEGYGERIAQDTGGAIKGNRIDVYVNDHQKALDLGVVYKDVWLMEG